MLQPFLHLNEAWNLVYQTQQVSKNAAISHFRRCPRFDLVSMICVVEAHSGLQYSLFFFTFFWSLPYCWSGVAGGECNFWYTLEVAGEFGPAAPPLSSTLNWGFCSNSLSGCMVILNEWTCSEQEASASTYPKKKMVASFFFFFSSAETLIISKTANIGEVFIWIPCVYSSPWL